MFFPPVVYYIFNFFNSKPKFVIQVYEEEGIVHR